jgi:hypothetical protein
MKIILLAAVLFLAGCDQMKERAGFPDPARMEAEGKAIGGGCRNSGRGLEDCYRLNPDAGKAAIYAGWKEMNEYMAKNNMVAVEPSIPSESLAPPRKMKRKKADAEEDDAASSSGKSGGR